MPNNMNSEDLIIVGASEIGQEYSKVLSALGRPHEIIGRGDNSASLCERNINKGVHRGGIANYLSKFKAPTTAIVATSVDQLFNAAVTLIEGGIKKILLEKPGALSSSELIFLGKKAQENNVAIFIGYNRRFYSSTRRAVEIIADDGGVQSFTYEFTEWSNQIELLKTREIIKNKWIIANSSHVIDLAHYIGGSPDEFSIYKAGREINWHPSASKFVGSGITKCGSLFSFHANWGSAGRWGLEFCTKNYRLILRPLEELQIQRKDSIEIEKLVIDNHLDKNFKPGFYLQTASFINSNIRDLCSIDEMISNISYYENIGNYIV